MPVKAESIWPTLCVWREPGGSSIMEVTMGASEGSSPVRVREVLVVALPGLRDRLLEEAIRKDWNRLVGLELGRRSRPGRLKAGVLDVTIDNSPWLHEMTLRSSELTAALQTRFGSAVASVRLGFGVVPAGVDPVTPRPRPEPQARLSHEETRVVEAMVASLPDPTLAGSLRRLLTKDLLARRRHGLSRPHEDSRPAEREDS